MKIHPRCAALMLGLALAALPGCATSDDAAVKLGAKHVSTGDRFYIESGMPDDQPIAVRVIRGGTGKAIERGQTAVVHYTGTFADGTKFDSSRDRDKPFRFPLGARKVIRGWDLVVARMHIGDQWKVMIPYALAYGTAGSSPVIPPATDLFFEMELLDIE